MSDLFLTFIGWIHAVAAVAWVGGGIFYWVVLRPAARSENLPQPFARFAAAEFGQLVVLSMWTLAITGGVLVFSRLSEPTASLPYVIFLTVKIVLSAWMFFLTLNRGRGPRRMAPAGRIRRSFDALGHVNVTVILGVIVFLLSDILRWIVVQGLQT